MHLYSIQRWSLKSPEELWTPRVSAAVIEHNDPAVHQESSLMEGNNRHQQDLFNGCFAYIHFKTMSALVTLFQRLIFLFFYFRLLINMAFQFVCSHSGLSYSEVKRLPSDLKSICFIFPLVLLQWHLVFQRQENNSSHDESHHLCWWLESDGFITLEWSFLYFCVSM